MEIHIKIIGTLFILLGLVHVIFPTYFKWKTELGSLSLINKQMMYVHTFFIAFMVLLMGILCVTSSAEIASTDLGKKIALGMAIFWGTRMLFQFFGYSSKLWKGKIFETVVHIVFSFFWIYVSTVFTLTYLG